MSGIDFLDTNILVYSVDKASPAKQVQAQQIVHEALIKQSAVISFQVVQETLHVLRRRFRVVANAVDSTDFLKQVLSPLWRVQPSPALYARALALQERYQFSFYDALIVAAALEAGCERLLSEDLTDGQKIEGLTITNPFRA
jgi:predicted nucleic acid-binding protein